MPTHTSSSAHQSCHARRPLVIAALIAILLPGAPLPGSCPSSAHAEEQSPYRVGEFRLFDKPSYMAVPPEISGKWVMWRGSAVGNRFTFRNMETGLDSILTTQGAPSLVPDIDGDTLVVLEGNVQHENGIFAYHIPDGARTTIVPHAAGPGFYRGAPRVSGNVVVWEEGHGSGTDIFGYDLAAQRRFTISADPAQQDRPAIAGNVVVWRDRRNGASSVEWDVYGYDLGAGQEFRVTPYPDAVGALAVSSRAVVWELNRFDGVYIMGYDLAKKDRFTVARLPPRGGYTRGFPSHPDADGDLIVWSGQGEVDVDVYGYDVEQRKQFVISRELGNQQAATISGRTVVWIDDRHTCPDGPDRDIYGARLEPGPAPIPPRGIPETLDAKIEIVWPHDQPVTEADKANVGAWLFQTGTLRSVCCVWNPHVRLWMARNNEPVRMVATAQRDPARREISAWVANDVDVSAARDPRNKLYFYVTVDGVTTRGNVWAHAADARTYYPQQDTPAAVGAVGGALDAKIEIVWPHGNAPVAEAKKVNVSAALFSPGTLVSVSPDFASTVRLYRSLNNEVSTEVATGHKRIVQDGGLVYPVWDFDDVDVSAANDPANKYYFTIAVDGVATYTNVWAHGADARTYFPRMDVVEGE